MEMSADGVLPSPKRMAGPRTAPTLRCLRRTFASLNRSGMPSPDAGLAVVDGSVRAMDAAAEVWPDVAPLPMGFGSCNPLARGQLCSVQMRNGC